MNHEAGDAGSLSRSILLLACLAAKRRGLLWLWLDKFCIVPEDTIPENCFGEAYTYAAAVLSFPGPRGLVELAALSARDRTHTGSLLWRPYIFISLFVHTTRHTRCDDNHWIIHHWRWEDSEYTLEQAHAEKHLGWTVYDYWQKCDAEILEMEDYRQLLYLVDGSAMTNIKVLMEDEAYGLNRHSPRHGSEKGMSLWRGYFYSDNPTLMKESRLLCNISAPQIIAFGNSHSTPVRDAPDAVIRIRHIIETYSQFLLQCRNQSPQVQDLRERLTAQLWDAFTLFEPNYPASFPQAIAWTLGYIHNTLSISRITLTDLADVPKLSRHTWSINGPPHVLHYWREIYAPRFLAKSGMPRRYKIPVYLVGLDNMADRTRYEDFQYILELHTPSASGSHHRMAQLRWVIKGRAMPLQEPQDNIHLSKQPLQLYAWPNSGSDSHIKRVAIFAGYYRLQQPNHPQASNWNNYPPGNGQIRERIVILRRNEGSRSWYHETLGILQDPHWSRSAPHKEFEIKVLLPTSTTSGRKNICT